MNSLKRPETGMSGEPWSSMSARTPDSKEEEGYFSWRCSSDTLQEKTSKWMKELAMELIKSDVSNRSKKKKGDIL